MNYWDILGIIILAVIGLALYWEVNHLIDWIGFLKEDPCGYLRKHAYDYITWVFGTDFGWTLGE